MCIRDRSITSKNPLHSMSNAPANRFPMAKAYAAKRLRTNPIMVRMLGCNPVSYTHLDVYKRQHLNHTDYLPMRWNTPLYRV